MVSKSLLFLCEKRKGWKSCFGQSKRLASSDTLTMESINFIENFDFRDFPFFFVLESNFLQSISASISYADCPLDLSQWFSTGVPRHIRVPWDSARGAANDCNSLLFRPVLPSRGAAKYLNSWQSVPRNKKGWDKLI